MKDKTLSKSTLDNIKENMDEIKSLNDWDKKIGMIKDTRKLISEEKIKLSKLKNSLEDELEDENIDFGKMNLEKVISKIKKSNNLEKKIDNIKLLKLWLNQQKSKVIKN